MYVASLLLSVNFCNLLFVYLGDNNLDMNFFPFEPVM